MSTPSLSDPTTIYLLTSLTSGSSTILTATVRLESLLKTHKIPFIAIDVATDEKARMLWGRRSKGRRLPGIVKGGEVLGNFEECEEWNEYGELRMVLLNEAPKQPSIVPQPEEVPQPQMEKDKAIAESVHSNRPSMSAEERKNMLESISSGSAAASLKKSPSVASVASVQSNASSMAAEAAKRAKEMQLKSLRERVAKREEEKAKRESAAAEAASAAEPKEEKKEVDELSEKVAALSTEDSSKPEDTTTTTSTKGDSTTTDATRDSTTDEKQDTTVTVAEKSDKDAQVQVAVEGSPE
ncbi:hypothetical protein BJ508DRAFT_19117 [Ascobolus immersus RN42]|uniref:Glutaredoxin domain-containing protein n=1 Tax=Ascobolus immersus RN42 TaxID=1160509 RepID=A0A3N4HSQ6_ASCIM|nr:hypothetical protein BJ508DRAFT_19117 [Ascobolus immersus RN42]